MSWFLFGRVAWLVLIGPWYFLSFFAVKVFPAHFGGSLAAQGTTGFLPLGRAPLLLQTLHGAGCLAGFELVPRQPLGQAN
jgi:hypothetical protein